MDYYEFLAKKHLRHPPRGFDVPIESLNPRAHEWQRIIVRWALKTGRALLAEDCGLGKTLQQLMWGEQVHKHTGGKVLLLCPLAVQKQTLRESQKFAIDCPVAVCESQSDVADGISITNYDKLHLFDSSQFTGVILDEGSILKAFTGATKRQLCKAFSETPYRLSCSATPAPNDRMEIGNQSEFLGVLPSAEMLQRWFINSGDKVGAYRLRKHGATDFWEWMASWTICLTSPADLGFDDSGYVLPDLQMVEHVVESKPQSGFLFNVGKRISATEVHKEKRACLEERAAVAAELAMSDKDSWVLWCDTDYEADALLERCPDAVEVRGSHSTKIKEERFDGFLDGTHRVLITKPEIGGLGLNFQHCHKTTWFAGYSFERFYQSIRRMHRFGQTHAVECHVVRSENEGSIVDTVREKERAHSEFQREIANLMQDAMQHNLGLRKRELRSSKGVKEFTPPSFLKSKA